MISPELGKCSVELFASEAVLALKQGLLLDPDMPKWVSSDRQYKYFAKPLDEFPLGTISTWPKRRSPQNLNAWQLTRVSGRLVDGSFSSNIYTIISGITVIATRHEIVLEMLDEGMDDEVSMAIYESAQLQCRLGLGQPEAIDYANIDNALYDLDKVIKQYNSARYIERIPLASWSQ